jgi:hypothetical protein
MSSIRCVTYVSGPDKLKDGGDGGIRTLDRPLQAYNGLANRRLQPLGHISSQADMPEVAATRKRQLGHSGIALPGETVPHHFADDSLGCEAVGFRSITPDGIRVLAQAASPAKAPCATGKTPRLPLGGNRWGEFGP